jgi:hypothetical protein
MRLLKKIAIWGGIAFAALFMLGIVIQVVDPEGTKQRREASEKAAADRAAKREAEKKKTVSGSKAGSPSGATIAGGMVAMEMAKSGALKPSSAQVEALGRRAATEMDVQQGDRGRFVREFEHGFWVGWKTATQ